MFSLSAVDLNVLLHVVGMQYLDARLCTVHLVSILTVGVWPYFPVEVVDLISGILAGGKVEVL